MQNCYSIDWLCLNLNMPFEIKEPKNFKIIHEEIGTTIFHKRDIIYFNGKEFATLVYKPISCILRQNLGQIKIANYFLYQTKTSKIIKQLLEELDCTFYSISRIDICCDFVNMEEMKPQNFISKFLNGEIIKLRKTKFATYGKHSKENNRIDTIKFGTSESILSWKLYNKTIELKEVKDKNWIKNKWKNFGWNEVDEVWRLEVEINNTSNIALYINDKTFLKSIEKCFCYSNYKPLFLFLLNKNFRFKYNGNQTNISRLQDVILIKDKQEKEITEYRREANPYPNRQIKTTCRELFEEYINVIDVNSERAQQIKNILYYFIKRYNLVSYMEDKFKTQEKLFIFNPLE